MHINRLHLHFVPHSLVKRYRHDEFPCFGQLFCLVKLILCFFVAAAIGSVISIGVAEVIDFLMR
jgi:hypothetical protein